MLNLYDWYWIIDGNVYSSKRNVYVDPADEDYQLWFGARQFVPPMASEAVLWNDYMHTVLPPWMFDGTTFVQPAEGEYHPAQLQQYAEQVRQATANGGMVAEGIPIKTDTFQRTRITNARIAADADNQYSTTLLGSDGALYPVNATQIVAISDDVIAFGTNLADTYAQVHADIDSGTITTTQQVDDAFAAVSRSIKDGKSNHYRGVSEKKASRK